jgi:hypothetical protein
LHPIIVCRAIYEDGDLMIGVQEIGSRAPVLDETLGIAGET